MLAIPFSLNWGIRAGTPFAGHAPVPKQRETRLYQADFLLRDYGFSEEELTYDRNGLLPLHTDPKMLWAQNHLQWQPVEINRAAREQLLRVPGFGPSAAATILKMRKIRTITSISMLRYAGIRTERARDFILLNGKQPDRQLHLF